MQVGRRIRRLTATAGAAVGIGAAGICALAAPATAKADPVQDVNLPQFNPSPAGDRFFGVPSPFAPGRLAFHGGVVLDYAHNPLVLADSKGDTVTNGHIIENQMFLHVDLAFSLFNRVEINADMPFALVNSGDGTVSGGSFTGSNAFKSPDTAGLGDLRLGARFRIFGDYYDPFQIGVGGYVWLPTGSSKDFISSGSVRGQPQLLVGGRVDRFIYTAMLGPTLQSTVDLGGVSLGHQFNWGAGVGVLLGTKRSLQLGIETTGGVTLSDSSSRSTNAEAMVGAKYRIISPLEIGLAVGPGFTSGVGTPDFRGVFSFFYTPEVPPKVIDTDGDGIPDDVDACPTVKGVPSEDPKLNGCPPAEKDRDHDGILDKDDACPDEPGKPSDDPKKNGCPIRDTDGDGIFDDVDACPNEKGVASDDPKKNGCPVNDKDGDGIPDDVDACPTIPGIKTNDPKTNGCPGDSDGDGIRDDQDACPHEKGPADPDPTRNGCPRVHVTEKEIIILEQVQFDTGLATIKRASDGLLNDVAQVLKDHPEILKVEVQGHTDNRGSAQLNKKLSDDRAKSVVKALGQRGIDTNRLLPKGFGPDVPIATNDTDDGRQKNRRVQFIVLEKKPTEKK